MTRIMVFGVFDILHAGHAAFFDQARALSKDPYLIVSIARDINVLRIKGRVPRHHEHQRLQQVAGYRGVNKVILGDEQGYMDHIRKERPDIIALGYDQEAYVSTLAHDLKQAKLRTKIVRLKALKPNINKSSLIIPVTVGVKRREHAAKNKIEISIKKS